jgi:hypothetical protein
VLELKNKFPNLHYFLNKKKISPNQRTKPESNPGRCQSKEHKHTMFKHRTGQMAILKAQLQFPKVGAIMGYPSPFQNTY